MPTRRSLPRARATTRARLLALAGTVVAAAAASGCMLQTADDYYSSMPARPVSVVTADFDGNGQEDALFGYSASDFAGITLVTQDDYGFWAKRELSTFLLGSELMAVTDFDGDQTPDVVAAQRGADRLTLLRNSGNGTFTESTKEIAPASPPGTTRLTALASATAPSGKRLVAAAFETDDPYAAVRPRSVVTYEATRTGLSATNMFQRFDVIPGDARELRLHDVDGDGRLDLVIGTAIGTIQIYRGLGGSDGDFATTPTTLSQPGQSGPITALAVGDARTPPARGDKPSYGDWPVDGRADVVAGFGGMYAYGWRGRGGMSFDPPIVAGSIGIDGARLGALAIDPAGSGNWMGIGRDTAVGFAQTASGWQQLLTHMNCGPFRTALFHNDTPGAAETAPFAAAFTCNAVRTTQALIAVPLRRRLVAPAEVALGDQRAGTAGAAATVQLDAVDWQPGEAEEPAEVAINQLSLTGPDAAEFEIVRGDLGACTDGTGACAPQVRFAPRTPGAKQATLVIRSDAYRAAGAPHHSVRLTGTATGALATAPATLALGDVAVGASGATELTIANGGTEPLSISALELDGAGPGWTVSRDGCAALVAPGGSCTARVSYAPSAAGPASATVRVVSDSVGAAPLVGLSARGIASGVTAAPIALGPIAVGEHASATAAIVNSGNQPLRIASIAAAGPDAARVTVDAAACTAAPIPAAGGCDVEVAVAPGARGPLDAELRVVSDAPSSPNVVALTASGVQGVAQAPASVALGNVRVGFFAEAEVALENGGDAPLRLGSIAVDGGAATVVADACSGSALAVGQRCAATVRFAPTAVGVLDARLRVPNDGEGGERTIELTGTALPADVPDGGDPGPGPGDDPDGGDPGPGPGDDPDGGDPRPGPGDDPDGGNPRPGPGDGRGPGSDPGPGPGGEPGPGDRPRAASARLRLTAPARATVRRGRTVRLRIAVANRGGRAAVATKLRMRLPGALRWQPPRVKGRRPKPTRAIVVSLGRLAPGAAREVTLTLRALPGARRGAVKLTLRADGGGAAARATSTLRIR
ncbi:choice-of-anchor D domain-containing protein [Conexibacter arvalis]|uniref:Abnormal spindle-like microcephaly-associated protein ASH domain-containing protein n=1 Tax=Conexibacter arvalis TaxID=912552 RepID=A0A840IED7_9ACTN|nr:choice-of-anchor D domain-containing protein [Conexibacter arvalis]MBB4662378.1 hypothetical protein [Conexibacter arvalis]